MTGAEVDAPVPPQQVASEIGKAAYATRENLLLVTPYLVPTDAMRAASPRSPAAASG